MTVSADLLMEENFEYSAGNLYNQGGWFRVSTQQKHPIQVGGTGLALKDYQDESKGLSATLSWYNDDDNLQSEDLARPFGNNVVITSGDVFVSFLINVEEVKDEVYTFTLACPGTAGMTDGKALGSDIGRIFILPGTTDGVFKLGMSKYAGTAAFKSEDLALNATHLVVMSYTFVDGTTNDIVKVWVNPSDKTAAPETNMVHTAGADANTTRGIQGVYLRQGSTAAKNNPKYRIDAIRAATTWAELFPTSGGGQEQPDSPKVTTNLSEVKFENIFQGQTATKVVNVKGENLTGDITVALSGNEVTADVTVVTAEEAMATGGKNITLTYKAGANPMSATMTLTTDGADAVAVKLSASPYPVTDVTTLGSLALKDENDMNYYRYTGTTAVVTFVDAQNKIVYLQDLSGAIAIDYTYAEAAKVPVIGDKLSNIYLAVYQKSFGTLYYMPLTSNIGENIGTGTRSASAASVGDIKSDPESYINKLITLSDIKVTNGTTWGTAAVDATASGAAFKLRSFPGTDLAGTAMPSDATSVTGIVTSASASSVILSVRSSNDIVAAAPELESTLEYLIDNKEYQVVNTPVALAKIKVKASGVKSGMVWLSGTNRGMFSVDVEEIPAGTSETVITVTYTPTSTGSHSAVVNLDMSPTELSKSVSISAKAYDPENPPVITVDSSELKPFSCGVGETQKQTISYTASNLLDYGSLKVVQDVSAFQVSSTSLMKTGTYNIEITFAPKTEGDFSAELVFSADKAETVKLAVSGSTSGSQEEPSVEGDELVFDTASPHTSYKTDFENAGANYKPLSLEGWKNVAVTGSRAWWSKDLDGNRAAYVSAYDSQATDDTACEMLLVSPALDYANAESRILQFRIMGNLLTAGMNDLLEVVYIDPTGDEPYYETIDGLGIPATADYNEEWIPYTIDLEGLDLADVFFIGFRFTSLRGRESTAQYYVDDFAWGQTDVPFIRVHTNTVYTETPGGENVMTEKVNVTGLNLTNDIALSLFGIHASNFTLSHQTLPAQGGEFYLTFNAAEDGEYEVYVSLKSDNAPETLVYFLVKKDVTMSVVVPVDDPDAKVSVFTLQGYPLMVGVSLREAMSRLSDRKGEILIISIGDKTYKYKID